MLGIKVNETSLRLTSIPGIGLLTASAIVASVGMAGCFALSRRDPFRRGWGSPHANIPRAANKCWAGFPNAAMVISVSFWCMGRVLLCVCKAEKALPLCHG